MKSKVKQRQPNILIFKVQLLIDQILHHQNKAVVVKSSRETGNFGNIKKTTLNRNQQQS